MAHEILAVKLCQLDDRMGRLHSRIHMSETAGHDQLRQEINALERECAQEELVLRETLGRSRSGMVSVLARGYGQVEQIVQQRRRSRVRMMEMHAGGTLSAPVRTGVVDIGAAQEARRIDQAEEFMR